jgi:glycolate oxidase FAD binding subunit
VPQTDADRVATPPDVAALAATLRAAADGGVAIRPRGGGSWWADAPPGSDVVSAAALDTISDFDPADLVVTAGAGVRMDALASRLAARGAFLALDPPGSPGRTLGGVLGAGGAGPLAASYGTARDQVLGLVVVAGDGTVLRLGGRVVKNVAGFDLAKLVVGGHGGFGLIAEAHLRLRARPRADVTAGWLGALPSIVRAAAGVLAAGGQSAALEVVSPPLARALGWGDGWALLARALGARAAADEELAIVAAAAAATRAATTAEGDAVWTAWRREVGGWPVVLRIGADPASWADAVALAERRVGSLLGASVTVPRGTVRVGAPTLEASAARRLRADAAARRWPVTLERADALTRSAVGVWGALPAAAERLTRHLRDVFDPAGVLAVPLLS